MRPEKQGSVRDLYDTHGDRIYRFCLRLSGSASDAEDLAQEVFLAAFSGQAKFAGRSSVQTWLYQIALNCWRHSRRALRLDMAIFDDTAPSPGPSVEVAVTENVSLTCALSALPPDLREAFLLVRAEGLKYKEAADVLGVPSGTVQWRVHEASRRLRGLLTDPTD